MCNIGEMLVGVEFRGSWASVTGVAEQSTVVGCSNGAYFHRQRLKKGQGCVFR